MTAFWDLALALLLSALDAFMPEPKTLTHIAVKAALSAGPPIILATAGIFVQPFPDDKIWQGPTRCAILLVTAGCALLNASVAADALGWGVQSLAGSIAVGTYALLASWIVCASLLFGGFGWAMWTSAKYEEKDIVAKKLAIDAAVAAAFSSSAALKTSSTAFCMSVNPMFTTASIADTATGAAGTVQLDVATSAAASTPPPQQPNKAPVSSRIQSSLAVDRSALGPITPAVTSPQPRDTPRIINLDQNASDTPPSNALKLGFRQASNLRGGALPTLLSMFSRAPKTGGTRRPSAIERDGLGWQHSQASRATDSARTTGAHNSSPPFNPFYIP